MPGPNRSAGISATGEAARAATPPQARSGASVVITCEHGGNRIPATYRALFQPHRALLATHRGFDAGALVMARALAAALDAPLLASTVSRLLVDLNRSIGHPHLHFDPVRALTVPHRQHLLARHYRPYRERAERLVSEAIAESGCVIHLSCHSFTPVLHGAVRTADIGLLYDPARAGEAALCAHWKRALVAGQPAELAIGVGPGAASPSALVVRRNYPYAGRNDGLTACLRKRHPPEAYIGIELELNQKHVMRDPRHWAGLREWVIASLRSALAAAAVQTPGPAGKPPSGRRSGRGNQSIESCGAVSGTGLRQTGVSP